VHCLSDINWEEIRDAGRVHPMAILPDGVVDPHVFHSILPSMSYTATGLAAVCKEEAGSWI